MALFARSSLRNRCSFKAAQLSQTAIVSKRRAGGFTPSDMPIIKNKWIACEKVGKICTSMKNVAAGALPGAERHLSNARPFGALAQPLFELETEAEQLISKVLHVAIGTERGMCGVQSSNTVRAICREVEAQEAFAERNPSLARHENKVVVYGKRSCGVANTYFGKDMLLAAGEVKTKQPTFVFCCHLAEKILYELDFEWDKIVMYYNEYESSVKSYFRTAALYKVEISSMIAELQFPTYEIEAEDETIVENLVEFKLASCLFLFLAENYASEQSSRLRAMDSASKNCHEMEQEYEKIYQGLRKSKITNDMILSAASVKISQLRQEKNAA